MQNQFQGFSGELDENFKEFFRKLQNPKSIASASTLTEDLLTQVYQQLEKKILIINSEKIPFKIQQKNNSDPHKLAQQASQKIHQIALKKQQMLQELQRLKREEEKAKYNQQQKQQKFTKKYFKSEVTKQDEEKLKELKVSLLNFQQELKQKTLAYEEKTKKFKEQQAQILQQQKNEKCEERKKQIQKHLQSIIQRQQERKSKIQADQKAIHQLKNKKMLYEEMEQNWKMKQQQSQKKMLEIQSHKKKASSVDFQQIKEHSKKYEEIMQKQKEERFKRINDVNEMFNRKSQAYSYPNSRFLEFIMEQQNKRKQQQQEKKKIPKNMTEKKIAYAENIRVNFKPKIKEATEKQQQKKEFKDIRSLSAFEINQRGNQYMKSIHSNIMPTKQAIPLQKIPQKTAFKYKDYLKETRMARTNTEMKSREINQILKILKSQHDTQQQKFIKAKMIAQRIQEKTGSKSKNLVDSINAKIQILKEISQ